jgi:hypothetical protein
LTSSGSEKIAFLDGDELVLTKRITQKTESDYCAGMPTK